MIGLALSLAGLLLTPQQDGWRHFDVTDPDDVAMAIDPASRRAEGDLRLARGRMTRATQPTRYIMADLRADCAAKTLIIIGAIAYQDGTPFPDQNPVPDGGFPITNDPTSVDVIAYLCAA